MKLYVVERFKTLQEPSKIGMKISYCRYMYVICSICITLFWTSTRQFTKTIIMTVSMFRMDCRKTFDISRTIVGNELFDHSDVHPCEKVIGMFFQNQIWSRLLDINQLCLVLSKDPLRKTKSAKYLSAVISRGWVMKHWKKLDVNFAMTSSVIELWRRWVSLTIKCAILPKLLLVWQTGEARVLFHDFLCYFV